MLEDFWVSAMNLYGCSVDVLFNPMVDWLMTTLREMAVTTHQFADDTASSVNPSQFFAECAFLGTLSQSEQTDQDILLWIFIREESFPSPICGIISSKQLQRLRSHTLMDFGHLVKGASSLSAPRTAEERLFKTSLTPTSRYRTSRQSAPKSFIRSKAN